MYVASIRLFYFILYYLILLYYSLIFIINFYFYSNYHLYFCRLKVHQGWINSINQSISLSLALFSDIMHDTNLSALRIHIWWCFSRVCIFSTLYTIIHIYINLPVNAFVLRLLLLRQSKLRRARAYTSQDCVCAIILNLLLMRINLHIFCHLFHEHLVYVCYTVVEYCMYVSPKVKREGDFIIVLKHHERWGRVVYRL